MPFYVAFWFHKESSPWFSLENVTVPEYVMQDDSVCISLLRVLRPGHSLLGFDKSLVPLKEWMGRSQRRLLNIDGK